MIQTQAQHFAAALARLPTTHQFNTPTLQAFLKAGCDLAGLIDTCLAELYNDRWLDTAVGAQLDVLGRILDEIRGGRSDDDFRARLYLKIVEINSEGTAENLMQLFQLITEPASFEYGETYPAQFFLIAIEPTSTLFTESQVRRIMERAKAAGVGSTYLAHTNGLPAFAFAGDSDPNKDGFGDSTDPDIGGRFVSLY